jgi:hypothetical protein
MAMDSRTFFIPTPAMEAYRQWKSHLGLQSASSATDGEHSETQIIEDVPNRGLSWSGRWGPARILGRADFIPVDGGCVVHLGLSGMGAMSKLMLSSPLLERHLWRRVSSFRPTEGLGGD